MDNEVCMEVNIVCPISHKISRKLLITYLWRQGLVLKLRHLVVTASTLLQQKPSTRRCIICFCGEKNAANFLGGRPVLHLLSIGGSKTTTTTV